MKNLTMTFGFIALLSTVSAYAHNDENGWNDFPAKYEVPVSDDLKKFANFSMYEIQTRTENGVTEMKYTLPLEITGIPVRIHVSGDAERLNGNFAEMKCDGDDCEVKYRNLPLSEENVRKHLASLGVSGSQLEKRLDVFRSFSGDPAGIIRIQRAK